MVVYFLVYFSLKPLEQTRYRHLRWRRPRGRFDGSRKHLSLVSIGVCLKIDENHMRIDENPIYIYIYIVPVAVAVVPVAVAVVPVVAVGVL